MTIAADVAQQLRRVIASQGCSGTFHRAADATGPGAPVRFLLRHPSVRDDAVVNAYGVNAQILTFDAGAFTPPPETFDSVLHAGNGARYVFDAVVPRIIADEVVGWTAYVRGDGA